MSGKQVIREVGGARAEWRCLGIWLIFLMAGCFCAGARTAWEVVPDKVDVEAGGGGSQILIRGEGAEKLSDFDLFANGKRTSYLLARGGGRSPGQMTVILQAREDAPRNISYQLLVNGSPLPLKIRLVDLGKARQPGLRTVSNESIRDVVSHAGSREIVVSSDQVPQVTRTIPFPLKVAPDGKGRKVILLGKRLEAISDVRVRAADQPSLYRGKRGKLPFAHEPGRLVVEVMASRNTSVGEKYVLDLMVGKFRAVSVPFEIGDPGEMPVEEKTTPGRREPVVIELPESASNPPEDEVSGQRDPHQSSP